MPAIRALLCLCLCLHHTSVVIHIYISTPVLTSHHTSDSVQYLFVRLSVFLSISVFVDQLDILILHAELRHSFTFISYTIYLHDLWTENANNSFQYRLSGREAQGHTVGRRVEALKLLERILQQSQVSDCICHLSLSDPQST